MRLFVSPQIEPDLAEIGSFIAKHNPMRAVTFVQEVCARFLEIAKDPLIYRLRPDFGAGIRQETFGQYLILYRVVGQEVRIVRVVHGVRDLTKLKL